jgi:N-ethylmaleimide reductase
MKEYELFTPTMEGLITLLNHAVMAPLSRCRATGNIPNDLMAKYHQ